MRVLLDTNVLVSAVATRGLCADVVREVLASHELVVSPPLFRELRRALKDKLGVPRDVIAEVLWLLQQDTVLASPGKRPRVRLKDKADLDMLSSALSGRAELFVTGDKELLALGRIADVEIVSPRQFWQKLTAPPAGPGDSQ